MRFPFALSARIARHIITNQMKRVEKFALVLQLEPLHTCNLTCTGCGRIREYSTSLKDMMGLEDCLASAQECDAPMVSIRGGEPLIYPQIEALVQGLLEQKRIVYICTNAMFMRKKMREWLSSQLASRLAFVEEKLSELLASGLARYLVRRIGPTALVVDHERLADVRKLLKRLGQTPRVTTE